MLARLVWPASRLDELEGEDRALSVLLDAPFEGDLRAEAVEIALGSGLDGLHGEAYVELPLGDGLEDRVAALAERGLRAKVRCGGAEVPAADALARFLFGLPRRRRPVQGDRGPAPSAGGGGTPRLPQRDRGVRVRRRVAALSEAVELDADGLRWRDRSQARTSSSASAASSWSRSAAAPSSSPSTT